jgi:helicase
MDEVLRLALETLEIQKQAIIFCPSRASAEKTAEDIAKLLPFGKPEVQNLEREVSKVVSPPTKQCKRLANMIKKGVAFHHSGLHSKQKEIIENNFKEGKINIIAATPTLAAGLSLPVFRVIIKSLKRYSGKWGMDWIPVLEYLQMAGRAGRPEFEKYGEAIVVAKDEKDKLKIYEKYICGEPEDIYSKLSAEPILRMYLLSLISSGIITDTENMREFFKQTFWAHQYSDMQELEEKMDKILSLLKEWKFVILGDINKDKGSENKNSNNTKNNNDSLFTSALDLFKKNEAQANKTSFNSKNANDSKVTKLRATLIGKRISQLYLDPLTAKHLIDCLKRCKEIEINDFSFLQMISNTIEMMPLLRIKSKEQDEIQAKLLQNYDFLLQDEPTEYDFEYHDFMNSIKTALFLEAWVNEQGEDFLLEKYNVRPGEIRVKLEIANWLLYSCGELGDLLSLRDITNKIKRLRIRVKHGVKEELLTFMKLKGVGRKRARKLYRNGMKDLGDLKKIDFGSLSVLIGNKIAISVKEQLGEKVNVIPKGKRKGQLGLNKF